MAERLQILLSSLFISWGEGIFDQPMATVDDLTAQRDDRAYRARGESRRVPVGVRDRRVAAQLGPLWRFVLAESAQEVVEDLTP